MSESNHRLQAMREGGRALAEIRSALCQFTQPAVRFSQIEALAQKLIKEHGMKPSFSTVEGYSWATCIMKNDALCHGIPDEKQVEAGDLMTIDLGLINRDYHLDTTISFQVEPINRSIQHFLEVGRQALNASIARIKPGASVFQLSEAMEKVLIKHNFGSVYQLTGHGIGKNLHMDPGIPCVSRDEDKRVLLKESQTLATEVMYTQGKPDLELAEDGWTYQTCDQSLAAMFEETVVVTKNGVEILTREA